MKRKKSDSGWKPGWKKRLLALALSAAVGITSVPFSGFGLEEAYAAELKGISQSHWAYSAMQKMYEQGILSGDANGNMHPDRAVTRAEFISMINRAFNYAGFDDGSVTLPFTDMKGDEWYAGHIRAAYAQGYFSGISPTEAGAEQQITREAAAAMMCRNVQVENNTLQLTQFTDGTKVSQWSRGAVGAAVDKGYLNGYEDGTFRPKSYISRAEAAVMLSNAMGSVLSESGTYSGVYDSNVTISKSNVTLKDAVISGDLYITAGVGTGYLKLENVTVLGEVIVCGGGEAQWGGNSVELKHCNIQKLTVAGSEERPVSLYATGDTTIAETNIKSPAYLQNHADTVPGFDNVKVYGTEDTTLYLSGNFKMVDLINPGTKVVLGKGEVAQLTVDEEAKGGTVDLERGTVVKKLNVDGQAEITGKGDIESVVVTTNDVTIEQLPDQIEIRPGATAEIDGKDMTNADAAEASEAPRILAGYPKANELSSSSAKVQVSGNKPGKIYWALTYGDVKELSQEDIIKPSTVERIQKYGTLTAAESSTELEIALSSLEADAQFTVSAVLVDGKDNISRVKEVVFRTKDSTKPGFVTGYPTTTPISSHRFDIEAMPLKDGTIYWAVFQKGAAQPTAYQLRSQELKGAIVYGKRENCERNIEYILKAEDDKLVEDVSYDVYIMASDGERDSAIVKLTGVTKDTTPPEFLEGTPAQAKNEAKSVDVSVGANEEATVHYIVMEWDDTFPAQTVIDGSLVTPSLTSDEAKQQLLSGSTSKVAGTAKLTADVKTNVTINGLEEETPYRVYMLLEDRSGNYSEEIRMVEIKTRDVTPPTAYVTCENPVDGKMPVEEPIKIVFSEIVWNALSSKGGEEPNAANLSSDVIKLFDVTLNEETEVKIDFSKVLNEIGEKGATILVFPPEAFNNEKGLSSGCRYQFQLNNILDTSGNAMKKNTLLEIFETVPPLIILRETAANRGDMDYTFSLTPQSKQTTDYVLFDMLLKADKNIAIKLYSRKSAGDTFTPVKSEDGKKDTFILGANTTTSLHHLIDMELTFEKFNELEYIEYGIQVTQIEGDTEKAGWHTTVNIDVTCVAGQQAKLVGLFNGMSSVGDGNVSNVNYSNQNPKDTQEFIIEMPFIDNIVPSFINGYPVLTNKDLTTENYMITDTLIRPQLMTDRKATMYYLIAPKGSVYFSEGDEVTGTDTYGHRIIEQEALDKRAQNIRSHVLAPAGSFWGVYEIKNGQSMLQPTLPLGDMEDLQPDTYYEMFIVLKGVPEELSKVYYIPFKTEKVSAPVGSAQVTNRGSNAVDLKIKTDKRAKVDWLVMRAEDAENFKANNDAQTQANIIRNGQETQTYRIVDFGSGLTELNANDYVLNVTVNKVARPYYYVLFGVAQMVLSDGSTVGGDSEIFFSLPFTPRDTTPPDFTISTETVKPGSAKDTFWGYLKVISDEPLYYVEKEGKNPQPVTVAVLQEMVKRMTAADDDSDLPKFILTDSNLVTETVEQEDGTSIEVVKEFMLKYDNATNGNTSTFGGYVFCDVNGNKVGRILAKFVVKETKLEDNSVSYEGTQWDVTITKTDTDTDTNT